MLITSFQVNGLASADPRFPEGTASANRFFLSSAGSSPRSDPLGSRVSPDLAAGCPVETLVMIHTSLFHLEGTFR